MERFCKKDGEICFIFEDGKVVGWYHPDGPEPTERAQHVAEVFERMAFEAAEERDLAVWCIAHEMEKCEVCVSCHEWDEDCETWGGDCKSCGNMECACKLCSGTDKFIFDPIKAKKFKEKYEERERKNEQM